MPTIQVILSDVKQRKGTENILFKVTDNNDRQIVREVDTSQFDAWNDFATWLINQEPEFVLRPDKEKTLEIVFHSEIIDGETGPVNINVLDTVTVL